MKRDTIILASVLALLTLKPAPVYANDFNEAAHGVFAWEQDREFFNDRSLNRKIKPYHYKSNDYIDQEQSGSKYSSANINLPSKPSTLSKITQNVKSKISKALLKITGRTVKAKIINSNGSTASEYTISDYMTLNPGQSVELSSQ